MNTLIIFGAKYLIILSVLIFGVFWFKSDREDKKRILILSLIALPLSYLLAKILGHFYYDPRPFVGSGFEPLIPHAADNGFPSDHTLLAGSLASVVSVFSRKYGLILLALAFIVGLSRILAGVHRLQDVLGSILITTLVVFIVNKIINKYSHE